MYFLKKGTFASLIVLLQYWIMNERKWIYLGNNQQGTVKYSLQTVFLQKDSLFV